MNIWILNHHALNPSMSGGTRHYDFAKELTRRGHKVTIVASSFHYAKLQEMKEYNDTEYLQEESEGVEFIWFKTPPYYNNGIKRVFNMLSYMFRAIKIVPRLNLEKPDVVIGSSVHLFAVYAAFKLSKIYNTAFIMEVRDLWPQTLIDMGISKWHPFILLLARLEKFLYKKADKIITTLPKAHLYIESLGVNKEKIEWVSNGTDINSLKTQYEQKLDTSKFNILYTGTHGLANNLNILIDVAEYLRDEKNIHFTLLGDGPSKTQLMERADELQLQNITFLSSVAKNEVFDYLSSADLLYVGLKDSPLYKYGMSMNKVFDYLLVKKPILFVSSIEDNIVATAKAGRVIRKDDKIAISNAIKDFSTMDVLKLHEYGENGFEYLKNHFSIEILVNRLENVLQSTLKEKSV
ncbi:MAG: glycosyltransferase family 4 protein [Campylobacterota bacterium]|nr:glycosyltransferase family 4 protein [Campylobacterota bacterium]